MQILYAENYHITSSVKQVAMYVIAWIAINIFIIIIILNGQNIAWFLDVMKYG